MMPNKKSPQYPQLNPFALNPFIKWVNSIDNFSSMKIADPFAGNNILLEMANRSKLNKFSWDSFDINPKNDKIVNNDSIVNFPKNFEVCITIPPNLSKKVAKRMSINFPNTEFDDLYLLSLQKCIENCKYVAAIIPESFISKGLFHNYLDVVVSLSVDLYEEFDHPMCFALFSKREKSSEDFEIWMSNKYIAKYSQLSKFIPRSQNPNISVSFNDPKGIIGLIAADSTKLDDIKFIEGKKIPSKNIKNSSRSVTRISLDKITEKRVKAIGFDSFLKELNLEIALFRKETKDLFLTSFKGLKSNGTYRRRLDFSMAKKIIISVLNKME